jgi:hypothetical protein
MNYKILGLAFIITISSVLIIKASELGEEVWYAHCSLVVEIPEAWSNFAVHACKESSIEDAQYGSPDKIKICRAQAAILAIKKAINNPCEIYLQYAQWNSEESYRFILSERDENKGVFSGIVRRTYYDNETKKLIKNNRMFDIEGKLGERVYFSINNVGRRIVDVYGPEAISMQKINCILTVK